MKQRHKPWRGWFAFVVVCASATAAQNNATWVGTWASAQQLVEPANVLPAENAGDITLRQVVHLSLGGRSLRIRVSNRHGGAPLHFTAVHIARPVSAASSSIDPATDTPVSFSGRPEVTVPAGADYASDPVAFAATPLSDLSITLHLSALPARQTGHPGSRATSYWVVGDHVSAAEFSDAAKIVHWYFIAGVDVAADARAAAIVTLGDSITDGHGATTDGNDRWPDVLAKRLQESAVTRNLAVLNQGIGGNRLLLDGLGPNAVARLDHDVLAPPGVRYLIVLEGINDIGGFSRTGDPPAADRAELVQRLIAAYEQIIARAHAHGIRVIGATILPFVGSDYYHPSPLTDADRQAVNQWIRNAGRFDAVVDLDQVTRDPAHPERLLPQYDSGDHLHPSPAGYAAMAGAIPLSLFNGVATKGAAPAKRKRP